MAPDPTEYYDDQLAVLWAQLEQLFTPLNGNRVATKQDMSYLESWDVLAHLNRIFGPLGHDKAVLNTWLIFEDQRVSDAGELLNRWDVLYGATVRLTVRTSLGAKVSEDVATGDALNQPSRGAAHDLAIKSAVSEALKRCAKDLGNQFGLSLYNNGSLDSVVGRSLAHPNLWAEA